MASRSIRGCRIVDDSSSDSGASDSDSEDDLPDLRNIGKSVEISTMRRRKLGGIADNRLLRPLCDSNSSAPAPAPAPAKKSGVMPTKKTITSQRTELQTRKTRPTKTSLEAADFSEVESVHEETILEDFSASDFAASQSSDDEEEEEESEDSAPEDFLQLSPSKSKGATKQPEYCKTSRESDCSQSPSSQLLAEAIQAGNQDKSRGWGAGSSRDQNVHAKGLFKKAEDGQKSWVNDLANPLSQLAKPKLKPPNSASLEEFERPGTPTSSIQDYKRKGLASPSNKIARIPATPHHPHTDTFWDQEFIDEWNDEHSPKKQLFPLSTAASKSPKKPSSPKKGQPSQAAIQKAAKTAFEQAKHKLADEFLRELDERITHNKLSELTAATGGIRIEWTPRLLTTAGRANWKRETLKPAPAAQEARDGADAAGAPAAPRPRHRHHASIELSTRVIDDEGRLLNVVAHEFCHLASFMVSGVAARPHGREFRAWAAAVGRAFGGRGVAVTTRHSYAVAFRYAWQCAACAAEYRRHSRSIDPTRHRCGACRGPLRQTKPVPRAGAGKAKESDYQRFMKEQMRLIKRENPGSQQKDIMKMVASRWAQREKPPSGEGDSAKAKDKKVEGVTKKMDELTVVDLT